MKKLLPALSLAALLAGCTAAPSPAPAVSLVLITTDSTALVVADTRAIAADLGATLEVVEASDESAVQTAIDEALSDSVDVIIGVGDVVLDELDPAAASNLEQQFLIVGTQALEPTANLTATVFRDYEGYYLAGVAAGVSATADITTPPGSPLVDASVARFAAGLHSIRPSLDPAITVGSDLDFGCAITTDTAIAVREPLEKILAGAPGGVYSYGVADDAVAIDGCPASTSPDVQAAARAIASGDVVITDPLYFP